MPTKFQQRHYETIAQTIRDHKFGVSVNKPSDKQKQYRSNVVAGVVTSLADMFEEDNPKFKREMFIRKCGWH